MPPPLLVASDEAVTILSALDAAEGLLVVVQIIIGDYLRGRPASY